MCEWSAHRVRLRIKAVCAADAEKQLRADDESGVSSTREEHRSRNDAAENLWSTSEEEAARHCARRMMTWIGDGTGAERRGRGSGGAGHSCNHSGNHSCNHSGNEGIGGVEGAGDGER